METLLRTQINGLCLAVITILWLSGDRRKSSRIGADIRIYKALLASTAVMLVLDSAGWILDGARGGSGRVAVLAINALYYAIHTIPTALFVLYAHILIHRDAKRLSRTAIPLAVIACAVAVAAALSPFFGIFFTVDASNRYLRGLAFPAFAAIQYGLVAFALAFVVLNGRRVSHRVLIALLAYPLPMLAGAIIQMLAYGCVLIWPATTLFLLVASTNIKNRRARTDYLTGTANRRSLDEELERRIASIRPGRPLHGLLVDIDDFKSINDHFGHEVGDRALEDLASLMQSSVRVDDLVARMGGDEFVLLAYIKEPGKTEDLIRRIEATLRHYNASSKMPYRLSISIGRAVCDRSGSHTGAEFLALLDADMYSRKKDKKRN